MKKMKKIKEINNYASLINYIDIPHLSDLDITPNEISYFLRFKYGERILYEEVEKTLGTPDEQFLGKMIKTTFNSKWNQNYKALTSEYEVLYSNSVVYNETQDTDTTGTANHSSTSSENAQGGSSNDITSKVTAFDSTSDYDDDSKNVESTSHTSTTSNQESIDSSNNTVVNYKRGYTKQYSNGLDGATAIEKDISTRKSKYIDIVLNDIINQITLAIF